MGAAAQDGLPGALGSSPRARRGPHGRPPGQRGGRPASLSAQRPLWACPGVGRGSSIGTQGHGVPMQCGEGAP
ncbi:hypothetical protein HMPREF1550_01463 [Actinomyces sp. oral taxon 877 str. F0543]|nr:hypothetical protein HMPREF1550_01463 [Actinomyces sp. oral taxon 877 str. F0543]